MYALVYKQRRSSPGVTPRSVACLRRSTTCDPLLNGWPRCGGARSRRLPSSFSSSSSSSSSFIQDTVGRFLHRDSARYRAFTVKHAHSGAFLSVDLLSRSFLPAGSISFPRLLGAVSVAHPFTAPLPRHSDSTSARNSPIETRRN